MNRTETDPAAHPVLLPGLGDGEYRRIVAPVLQVTAELAAARGDPDLVNDMGSMLALLTLVRDFGDIHLETFPECSPGLRDAIRQAPLAACTLPLQRAELGADELRDCLWALEAASKQLTDAGVIGPEMPRARAAWAALDGDHRDAGIRELKLAAAELITRIDRWERAREQARSRAGDRPG